MVEKASKYSALGVPLLVFAFLGDHNLLDVGKAEKTLFGMTLEEVQDEGRFPYHIEHPDPYGGILLPDADRSFPHPNLAAVVVCDWFDTLNPADRGRRLHCVVLHALAPFCTLPSDAFAPFGQVQWRKVGDTRLEPYCAGDLTTVAKFLESGGLETRPYSADAPW
jgi:hypothetical protein